MAAKQMMELTAAAAGTWLVEWPCASRLCDELRVATPALPRVDIASVRPNINLQAMVTTLVNHGYAISHNIFESQVGNLVHLAM